jgi:hypothetical protein
MTVRRVNKFRKKIFPQTMLTGRLADFTDEAECAGGDVVDKDG